MSKSLSKFLSTLAATTVSIVLTFGTTAIIDRKKQKTEKREMVMMIMYDMRESLKEMEQCDNDIRSFFDTQVDILAHPQEFHADLSRKAAVLAVYIPSLTYSSTTENIFRSNVETIQTIGNILFVETVSSFYDLRANFKSIVADPFQQNASAVLYDYDALCDFDSAGFPFYAYGLLRQMRESLEQCKLMMKVTDKDLDVFSTQQEKLLEVTRGNYSEDTSAAADEMVERRQKLIQARTEGAAGSGK